MKSHFKQQPVVAPGAHLEGAVLVDVDFLLPMAAEVAHFKRDDLPLNVSFEPVLALDDLMPLIAVVFHFVTPDPILT